MFTLDCERLFHEKFAEKRVFGEWFRLGPEQEDRQLSSATSFQNEHATNLQIETRHNFTTLPNALLRRGADFRAEWRAGDGARRHAEAWEVREAWLEPLQGAGRTRRWRQRR